MKKIILVFVLTFCGLSLDAQIVPKYNMYNQNLFLLNPAAAGVHGNLRAFVGHKDQWSGVKNAPQTSYLSIDGMITNAMGLGVIVQKQTMGIFDFSNISLNYAYRIGFAEDHALAFGLNVNFIHNKVSISSLYSEELSDPALFSNKFDETLVSNAAGIQYRYKGLSVELSSPLLYSYQEEGFFQTAFLYAGYDFYLGSGMYRIQPSALLRYTQSSPVQADFNALFEWNRTAWGQVGYRTSKEVMFAAGVFIKSIGIGYAYEMNMHPLSTVSSGSHEIVVFFNSPFSISKKKPLYSDPKRRDVWN